MDGPLIVGVALLHMPALGEKAALYQVETINGGRNMTANVNDDRYQVPASFFDRIAGWLDRSQQEPGNPEKPPQADNFEAQVATMQAEFKAKEDEFNAKIQTLEAEQQHGERVAHFTAALQETVKAGDTALVELLAGLEKETADKLVTEFKALSAQINESNLTDPVGSNPGAPTDPAQAYAAAVLEYQSKHSVPYNVAVREVNKAQPDLFNSLAGGE
jgi:hypothetical protein